MAINGYYADVYPLDRIRGNLDGIIGSADPVAIKTHLTAIKQDLAIVMEKLPESKNPVWVFPTESTSFLRISRDVENMMDATPYMFVSVSNIVFSTMWIAAILGIFAALKRKKDQLTSFDEATGI